MFDKLKRFYTLGAVLSAPSLRPAHKLIAMVMLMDGAARSALDIGRAAGMPPRTVYSVLAFFCDKKIIVNSGTLYTLNDKALYRMCRLSKIKHKDNNRKQ